MADLTIWAAQWLTSLIAEGGAHGPGSRRTIHITGDNWSYLFSSDDINQQLAGLQRPSPGAGRSAVTYEHHRDGVTALRIFAVDAQPGQPTERVHLEQAFTKFLGRTRPLGGVTEIPTDDVPEPDVPASGTPKSARLARDRSTAPRTNPDDSVQYWTHTYDEPLRQDEPWAFEAANSPTSSDTHALGQAQTDGFAPSRPLGKRERDTVRKDRAPAATPAAGPSRPVDRTMQPPAPAPSRPTIRPSNPAPEVRSVTEALGQTRRYIDAVLMAGFGILCFVAAGSAHTDKPALLILVGCAAIAYSLYIALSYRGYIMPYFIYALAIIGGAFFLFK